MGDATPMQKYRAMLDGAAKLRKMGSDESFGGPTFWNNMRECTAAAIRCGLKPPEGTTWQMSAAQMDAIWSVCSEGLMLMWKQAGELMEKRAAALLDELKKQRAELDGTIAGIEADRARTSAAIDDMVERAKGRGDE